MHALTATSLTENDCILCSFNFGESTFYVCVYVVWQLSWKYKVCHCHWLYRGRLISSTPLKGCCVLLLQKCVIINIVCFSIYSNYPKYLHAVTYIIIQRVLIILCINDFCFNLFLRTFNHSCVALSDLLVSRQVSEIIESLPQLWELTLRVRDDVKVVII